MATAATSKPGDVGLKREMGLVGAMWASETSIIGSGWLFGAFFAATAAGTAALLGWVIGGGAGSGIDPPMLYALLVNFAAFLAFPVLVVWLRYRLERLRQQVEEAQALRVLAEPPGRAAR